MQNSQVVDDPPSANETSLDRRIFTHTPGYNDIVC